MIICTAEGGSNCCLLLKFKGANFFFIKGSCIHRRKVHRLTPAAFAKADLVIAFMLFISREMILLWSCCFNVNHLIPCRICHFPSVTGFCCAVFSIVVVEGESLGARLGSCLPDLILLCRIIHCEIWIRMYKLVIFLLCSYLLRYSRSLSLIPSVPFS